MRRAATALLACQTFLGAVRATDPAPALRRLAARLRRHRLRAGTMNNDRYRLYRLRHGIPSLVATAPDPEGIGLALKTLHEEGEFFPGQRIGILDRPDPDKKGTWLISPYATGGK